MRYFRSFLTVLLISSLLACDGVSSSCTSFHLINPSGLWAGNLVRQSSNCPELEAGPAIIQAEHDVFFECVFASGEEDEELRLVDQSGRSLEQTSYNTISNIGSLSFTVKGERTIGIDNRTETSEIEYEDLSDGEAKVSFVRKLSGAGKTKCTEEYSGVLVQVD